MNKDGSKKENIFFFDIKAIELRMLCGLYTSSCDKVKTSNSEITCGRIIKMSNKGLQNE